MAYSTLLEDYILSLYQAIHIYEPNQLDIEVIAKRLQIDIEYINSNSKTIQLPRETIILIDQRLSPAQQWQDFGHELGHLLRHCGNQLFLPPPFVELQEWQANNFALHFCIPTFMLEQLELPGHRQEASFVTAQTFNVEPLFAARRLDKWLQQKEALYFQQFIAEAPKRYV